MTTVCRYGRECSRADCHFGHPKGRAMDDGSCRFGLDCKRPDCQFQHPQGRLMDGAAPTALHVHASDVWLSLRPLLPSETQAVVAGVLRGLLHLQTIDCVPPTAERTVLFVKFATETEAAQAVNVLLKSEWAGRAFHADPTPPHAAGTVQYTTPAPYKTPVSDGSVPVAAILARLRRVSGGAVIMIDGDNFPEAASILVELFPLPQPPDVHYGFLVIAFVGVQANFKSFPLAAQLPCFMYMRALTNAKDAADHDLSMHAMLANMRLPTTCPLYVCSRDGFAREAMTLLKQFEPDRDIQLVSKDMYRNFVTSMQFRALGQAPGRFTLDVSRDSDASLSTSQGYPKAPVVAPRPAPRPAPQPRHPPAANDKHEAPVLDVLHQRSAAKRPDAQQPCKVCKRPGGLPDSHWYWHCPFRAQPSRYTFGDEPTGDVVLSSENQRFARYVAVLQEYVTRGIFTVRLSNLGMLLRERYVYSEKNGLGPLNERAVEEGLVLRQGDQGMAELVILPGKVEEFIMRRQIAAQPVVEESTTPAPSLYAAFAALLRSYAISGGEAKINEDRLLPRIRERLIGSDAADLEALLNMAAAEGLILRSPDGTCIVCSQT